jgi:hypothetical protein
MKKLFIIVISSILAFSLYSCTEIENDLNSPIDETNNEETFEETLIDIPEETPDSTKIEIIEEDEIFCIEVYQPVCGMVLAEECEEGQECEYLKQTFSNSCYAEKAKAINIEEGACE